MDEDTKNIQEEKQQDVIDIHKIAGESNADETTLVEMAKAGVFYGHKKSRKNPRFDEYIYGLRNGVAVIDLVKTLKAIDIAAAFLKNALAEEKMFLIVGIQPASRNAVLKLSEALGNCSYVVNRWIGGLITNFAVIGKRIDYYKKRKSDMEQGKFEGYTKKERLLISREIEKMGIMFTGLENFIKIPDIVFVIDGSLKGHRTAVHEAMLHKLSLVGIIDNDDNPGDFQYFIPANDHTKASIEWIVGALVDKMVHA